MPRAMAEEFTQLIFWQDGIGTPMHKSVSSSATIGQVAEKLARELDLPEMDFWGKKRLRYTLHHLHSDDPLSHNLQVGELPGASQLKLVGYPESEVTGAGEAAARPAPRRGALVLVGGKGERFPFERTVNVIGRLGGHLPTDINLEPVDHGSGGYRVSRNHAELRYSKGCWMLRLLDARNETFVDGKKLEDGEDVEVKHGSTISIARESPICLQVELG